MKLSQLTLAIAVGLSLTACDQLPNGSDSTAADAAVEQMTQVATDTSEVMATVNGVAITKVQLDTYMVQRQRNRTASANTESVIEELINLELSVQDSISKGLDKDEAIAAQLDQQRKAVLASAGIKKMLDENPITDAQMKALYEEKTGAAGGKEFKARHILVKTEQEAIDIISKLDTDADFSELAKELSTGPTGKNGGDLGWFSSAQMVKPFSDAVAALEKDTYTKTPVETQFGWHVIIHDDSRSIEPPPFEQLKPQIQGFLQKERLQNYLGGLKEKANIIIQYEPTIVAPPAMDEQGHEGHGHGAETESAIDAGTDETEAATETSSSMVEDAKEEASGMVEEMKEATSNNVDKATDMAKDAADTVMDAASDVVDSAKDAASSATDPLKNGMDAVKDAAGDATMGDAPK